MKQYFQLTDLERRVFNIIVNNKGEPMKHYSIKKNISNVSKGDTQDTLDSLEREGWIARKVINSNSSNNIGCVHYEVVIN